MRIGSSGMLQTAQTKARISRRVTTRRTCVACKKQDVPDAFLRVVATPDDQVAIDLRRNLGGRGANICPTRACVEAVFNKRALSRVLKRPVRHPKAEEFIDDLKAALLRQLETLARSSAGSRHVVFGADLAERALRAGQADCLLIAMDTARRDQLTDRAVSADVPVATIENKEQLGALFGRVPTGTVAITDRGLARAIERVSQRISAF
ncbi:MAG: DUF448 domain-containing protein [Deltaproteobacteria bacterium]|nr:DUF448 domain-containing protein [Deltaproteobacteria bacterium]